MSLNEMSEQDRLELSAKLDEELDQFIEGLPRRQQGESVPFDRWEEDLINHPFFLKDTPQPGDKLHPLYEGLQKLKYDPEENEPEELAVAYKDDGNFNFKYKKYRMAIISYTEGLKAKSGNTDIDATLYNNRSASHYFLKNYRSSLMDCEAALKLKPDYDKAVSRAANCCYRMGKYDRAIEYCDKILEKNKSEREILELRKKCVNEAKVKKRDSRKREIAARKVEKEEEIIVAEILKRGIKIAGGRENLTLNKLEPQFPQLFNSRVSITESGHLIWPVILFYPEYKIMDYIQQFDESDTLLDQLQTIFQSPPEWDDERKYAPDHLSAYFENEKRVNVKIDVHRTLLNILQMDEFLVKEGTPRFIILVSNSRAERQFLSL